ncbi:ATG8-interacting protein 1-like isoform X1 [Iris pallida]|uniref:ATG8-interacting protein 1-like isoform X1 n=1 Tax=Iris pallida TaxID=29817 RepID=A0AAX6FM90_IRIPA|nr:ATG8-interacting protein 1-like isoform X1 [Iris pallida]
MMILQKAQLSNMADDEKDGDNSSRNTEWEFVSLTASAYAAAPGPKGFDLPDETTGGFDRNGQEVLGTMFMSKHFIFPPPEHENLLLEPDCSEIHNEPVSQGMDSAEELNGSNKFEDNWKMKSDDGLDGLIFDKGKSLSDHSMVFGEGKPLEGLAMVGKEHIIYGDPGLSAFDNDTDGDQSVLDDENTNTPKANDSSHENIVIPSDSTNVSKQNEGNEYDGSDVPCEAWWKRQAMSVYNRAKEGNTFWSVFVAAAFMGLVILGGQQWQREKLHFQQLKLHFVISDESCSRMRVQVNRLKDILVGGHQQNLLIRGSGGGTVSNQPGI